jgi:hypothetical protein
MALCQPYCFLRFSVKDDQRQVVQRAVETQKRAKPKAMVLLSQLAMNRISGE